MISWIQKYFQHHFRSIFAVLLVFIIISFVAGINASGGFGRGDRQHVDRQFFDYNLGLPADQQRLIGDASLSAQLRFGAFDASPEQIQSYAFQRAASLHLADQWHIPAATDVEITDQIKTLRMFQGQDGQFDAKAYVDFRDNLKKQPRGGAGEGDIKRVISDDVRAQKVNKLISGPGYVLPNDVKTQLAQADTTWTVATAAVDYASFKPEIKATDADLAKYFGEEAARYEITPRVVATYVDFSAINFISSVTVTEADVRSYYDANPARFPKPPTVKPADDKTPPVADPAADYAAVRAQVETTLKLDRAKKLAAKAASDLALSLYNNKVPAGEIDAFLAKQKYAAKSLAPFSRETGPVELGGDAREVAAEAFKLPNQGRYYSEVVNTQTGAVILFWKETQPARKPALAEVRDKVVTDWTDNEKRRRFIELGKTIKSQLEARLKAGDTIEKAAESAASANSVKIEAKTLAPFTLRNPSRDIDYNVYGALQRLEKGQISDMSMAQDKGLFVYAADKKAPDLTEANPQYVATRNELANSIAGMGANAYLSDLVQAELKKSEPKAAQP
jgi:peptidyl-prolyl cis-trans isomerase D